MDNNNMDSETIIEQVGDVMESYVDSLLGEDNEEEVTTPLTVATESVPTYLTMQDLQVALSPISFLLLVLVFQNCVKGLYTRSKKGRK